MGSSCGSATEPVAVNCRRLEHGCLRPVHVRTNTASIVAAQEHQHGCRIPAGGEEREDFDFFDFKYRKTSYCQPVLHVTSYQCCTIPIVYIYKYTPEHILPLLIVLRSIY